MPSIPTRILPVKPEEMAAALQHRSWDRRVEGAPVPFGLSFGGVPAKLVVPFAAVMDFVDPAVDFSLKFQANGAPEGHEDHDEPENDEPIAEPIEDGSNVVSVDFTRKK